MEIRKATIEDSAGIARVQVDSYRTAYAGIRPQAYLDQFSYEEQEQDWRDWITTRPEDLLYVAELKTGEIVGYALARPGPSEVPPYDSELVALHVRGAHQRQGVGRRLVVAAQPALGKPRMERWIRSADAYIRWIMRQDLGKKRILRSDERWVRTQLEALGL